MTSAARPYRSVLYIPGARARALDKARSLAADAIIFDLEDAVAPDEKAAARQTVHDALAQGGYGQRSLLVRINGFDTPWWEADLDAIAPARPQAILLPKVRDAADVQKLAAALAARPGLEGAAIWAMMETPQSVLNATSIAGADDRLAGFVLGTNDLARELQSRARPDRLAMLPSLGLCLLAARAAGLVCVDGVFNAFRDEDGLRAEAEQGRDMGFDGKTLIHPAQLGVTNEVFAPSTDELDLSRRQIAAYDQAMKAGTGIAVVDGQIVENLHVETARRLIAQAQSIAELEAAL